MDSQAVGVRAAWELHDAGVRADADDGAWAPQDPRDCDKHDDDQEDGACSFDYRDPCGWNAGVRSPHRRRASLPRIDAVVVVDGSALLPSSRLSSRTLTSVPDGPCSSRRTTRVVHGDESEDAGAIDV